MNRPILFFWPASLAALCFAAAGLPGVSLGSWPMFRGNEQGTGTLATRGVPVFHRIKWQFKAGKKITGSAAVGPDAVYFGDWGGTVYALSREDGKLLWTAELGRLLTSTPALVDGILYVGGADAKIYTFESQTGKRLWEFDTRVPGKGRPWMGIRSSPVVSQGFLYVGNQHGR